MEDTTEHSHLPYRFTDTSRNSGQFGIESHDLDDDFEISGGADRDGEVGEIMKPEAEDQDAKATVRSSALFYESLIE